MSSRARVRSRSASCASSGTHTGVNSPARSSRASDSASRRSVFTRSPALRGISDGATTLQRAPSGQLPIQPITARPRLVADIQNLAVRAQALDQLA